MINWIGCGQIALSGTLSTLQNKRVARSDKLQNSELVPNHKVGMEDSSWERWPFVGNIRIKIHIGRGNGLPSECQTIPICKRGAKGATVASIEY